MGFGSRKAKRKTVSWEDFVPSMTWKQQLCPHLNTDLNSVSVRVNIPLRDCLCSAEAAVYKNRKQGRGNGFPICSELHWKNFR